MQSAATDNPNGPVTEERPSRVGLIAMVVIWAAVVARLFTFPMAPDLRPWYVAGLVAFLLIQLVVLLRPPRSAGLLHLAFAFQAAIVLVLLALNPQRDFLTALLALQCYPAALVFRARIRVVWVALLVTLIGASLVLQLGVLHGLALALVPMAAGIVLSTYPVESRELQAAQAGSERMVADLQAAQQELQLYAGQVDELAAIEQRSRLARELQESVSDTLASVLNVSASARELLDDPDAAALKLEHLQALTQQALAQMRRIISELRPVTADTPSEAAVLRER